MSVLPRGYWSGAANTRIRCSANPLTLTRHVHKQHLQYLPAGQPFARPRPLCSMDSFLLEGVNHYRTMLYWYTSSCTVMRNAYYLVGLDGECGHMIVEAAPPSFLPNTFI
jgi:hypothetical protein